MSISKETLKTALNGRLNRQESDIDDLLTRVLRDLTRRIPALAVTVTFNTAEGVDSYDKSSENIRAITGVTVDDAPINLIGFEEYLKLKEDETESGYDEPTKYALRGGVFYFYHTPDDAYEVKVYCTTIGMSQESIELPDYYEEALICKLCALYCVEKELMERAAPWIALYEEEISEIKTIIRNLQRRERDFKNT